MICIPSVLLYISEENLIIKWFSISGNVLALKSVSDSNVAVVILGRGMLGFI